MKKLFLLIIGMVVVGVVFHSCRKSYDPGDWDVEPTEFLDENEYTGPTKTLKVMSFNLALRNDAHLFGTMKDVIKAYDPDLLFLRQVDSATTRAQKVNRPQEIADALGMDVFFKKNFDYQTGGFGNAVLSKFPISEKFSQILSRAEGNTAELRSFVMLKVAYDEDKFVYFGGTELDPDVGNRSLQAIDILRATQDIEEPVILVGNFNEKQTDAGPALTYLNGSFIFACPETGCAFNAPKASPNGTYDYITYQDPDDLLIVSKYLEPFREPESANTFFPTVAEIKIKLEK